MSEGTNFETNSFTHGIDYALSTALNNTYENLNKQPGDENEYAVIQTSLNNTYETLNNQPGDENKYAVIQTALNNTYETLTNQPGDENEYAVIQTTALQNNHQHQNRSGKKLTSLAINDIYRPETANKSVYETIPTSANSTASASRDGFNFTNKPNEFGSSHLIDGETANSRGTKKQRNKKKLACTLAIILIVILVLAGVTVGVILALKKETGNNAADSTAERTTVRPQRTPAPNNSAAASSPTISASSDPTIATNSSIPSPNNPSPTRSSTPSVNTPLSSANPTQTVTSQTQFTALTPNVEQCDIVKDTIEYRFNPGSQCIDDYFLLWYQLRSHVLPAEKIYALFIKVYTPGLGKNIKIKAVSEIVDYIPTKSNLGDKGNSFGLRQTCPEKNVDATCVEVKGPTDIACNILPSGRRVLQQTLVRIRVRSAIGTAYKVSAVSNFLNVLYSGDINSGQSAVGLEEFAILIKEQDYGPNFGIYWGKGASASEARNIGLSNCLRGKHGAGENDPTTHKNWAVTFQ